MKLFAAKLALYLPSVAVLGVIAFSFITSLPDGRLPLLTAISLGAGCLGLGAGMVICWNAVSGFVNRRFGG